MPRNAVAYEWPDEERELHGGHDGRDFAMPPGAYYFMIMRDRKVGIIHGCPCGCGTRSAMWFEGEENAGGPKWTVVGEWPKVTLAPSIGIGRDRTTNQFHWHGFLEGGTFVEK